MASSFDMDPAIDEDENGEVKIGKKKRETSKVSLLVDGES